jgi:alpha-galactosidase
MSGGRLLLAAAMLSPAAFAAGLRLTHAGPGFRAEDGTIAVESTSGLGLRVFLRSKGRWVTISSEPRGSAVSLRSGDRAIDRFSIAGAPVAQTGLATPYGPADRVLVKAARAPFELELTFDFPARHPGVAVLTSRFVNRGSEPAAIAEVNQAALALAARGASPGADLFWSLQGGGYKWGADFILPVRAGFQQDNYTGPKGNGNGGGFPMADLWRPEMGVAVSLLDPKPALAWAPVEVSTDSLASLRITTRPSVRLLPGESYAPAPAMIAVHTGDFYDAMVRYRELMDDLGVHVVKEYEPEDYSPAYCTWGYERKFTMDEVLAKLPQMQQMGMTDFILDDGWFDLFGNWLPTSRKFPGGVAGMQAVIAKVHAAGKKFRLWWSPGSADPGSEIDRRRPDWFILDRAGKREKASWNAYYLCPAYAPVREAMLGLARRFVVEWNVDAFKSDGTDLNHAPLCFNAAHRHARPEESFEQWPELMRAIRDEARRLKPGFRVELGPCGITPTFQLAAAMEQPTDSDPYVHQVTSRTKFLKAMFGPRSPVLQEYVGVEVKDASGKASGVDIYPRAIGAGEVVSTFTTSLGPQHARWTEVYNRHRPSEGEYLNLYDIGWEPVEGHAIRKGDRLYYGFFTRKPGGEYSGKVELRGLATGRRYRVIDYANSRALEEIQGPAGALHAGFHDALFLVAEPI